MEPFFSVEERMKLILSVIQHTKITFSDAYKLSNLELETLNRLLNVRNRLPVMLDPEILGEVWDDDCDDLIGDQQEFHF